MSEGRHTRASITNDNSTKYMATILGSDDTFMKGRIIYLGEHARIYDAFVLVLLLIITLVPVCPKFCQGRLPRSVSQAYLQVLHPSLRSMYY